MSSHPTKNLESWQLMNCHNDLISVPHGIFCFLLCRLEWLGDVTLHGGKMAIFPHFLVTFTGQNYIIYPCLGPASYYQNRHYLPQVALPNSDRPPEGKRVSFNRQIRKRTLCVWGGHCSVCHSWWGYEDLFVSADSLVRSQNTDVYYLFICFTLLETGTHSVARTGVQWGYRSSPQPLTPGLKRSPASASQSTGIMGVNCAPHPVILTECLLYFGYSSKSWG